MVSHTKIAQNRAFVIVDSIDAKEDGEEYCARLIENAIDIEFRVGWARRYRSANILVRIASPTIYIDTGRKTVIAICGADRLELNYTNEALDKEASKAWESYAETRSYA